MQVNLLSIGIQDHLTRLRASLRALVAGAGADPRLPQEVSRRFGIDRVLCWKIARIVKSISAEDALRQLPTEEAFEIFLAGFERAKASEADIAQVREVARATRELLAVEVGDRATLELMLDAATEGPEGLLISRKLAFRGNSGIWGVQARLRHQLTVVAPNADDPDRVDVASVAAWQDFRRLRPNAPWRVFFRFNTTGSSAPLPEPVDGTQEPGGAMLLPKYCKNLPLLLTEVEGDSTHYELGPSAAGSLGAFNLVAGMIWRQHGARWATPGDTHALLGTHIMAPVERLVVDVLVHRSLELFEQASMSLHSAAFHNGSSRNEFTRLPVQAMREDLGQPPAMALADAPDLGLWTADTMLRGGWNMTEFRGLRFQMDYPPFPSVAVVECPLSDRPS